MRFGRRLLRALVADIIADVDETAREVVLTIHRRGRTALAIADPRGYPPDDGPFPSALRSDLRCHTIRL